MIKKLAALSLADVMLLALSPDETFAQTPALTAPQVEVLGIVPDRLDAIPGSTFVIGEERLEETQPFTTKEALRLSPGVHVVDEDAFGLNTNIGIRGLDPRRSSRTLLLEDGAPIHLAPYSDPTTHYVTPVERVRRIEVLKGSGQIIHGPQTVGGVLNFVGFRPPTSGLAGSLELAGGNRDFGSVHANIGAGGAVGGIMLDFIHKEGDGTRRNHDHGVDDILLTGLLNISDRQSIIVKAGYYEEDSKFSEGGHHAGAVRRRPVFESIPQRCVRARTLRRAGSTQFRVQRSRQTHHARVLPESRSRVVPPDRRFDRRDDRSRGDRLCRRRGRRLRKLRRAVRQQDAAARL